MDQVSQPAIHKLAILNWNANGISSKKMIFTEFLVRHNIDIACVSETHLTPKEKFTVSNYKVFRSDRIPEAAAGGVAVFVKRSLYHEAITLPPMLSFEIQGVMVSLSNGSQLKIFATYLQPRKTVSIRDLNNIFNGNVIPTIVAGDLNSKHPAWFSVVSNPNGRKLFKLMNQSEWFVLGPDEPTYFPSHENRHPDVLDILVCKNVPNVISQTVLAELDSDHNPVIIELDAISLQCPSKLKLINGPVDWDMFCDKMDEDLIIPTSFDSTESIDNAIELFTDAIKKNIAQSSGPPRNHQYKFVLPCHLRMLIAYKHRVRRRWQRNKRAVDKRLLNIITKKLKYQLDEFRYEGYQEYLKDLHPDDGTLYKETKRILRQHDSIPPIKRDNDNFITSADEKCEAFADMLEDTFTVHEDLFNVDHVNQVKQSVNIETPSVELPIPFVSPSEVQTEIHMLKNKKSPGHDLITNEVIKALPFRSVLFLTAVFNACLRWSYFPYMWKHAQVTMIAKPGKPKQELKSYRPISLLPTLSKLLERILASRLKTVLHEWSVIPDFQFGFREAHSTIHQMARFSEFVNSNFECRNQVSAVFLDFQQAFDRVWHEGLIYKMKSLHFPKYLVNILASFLHNRTFAIKLEEHFSTIRPVLASVPQGSVLGPILYNLYVATIADSFLPANGQTFIGMFADDLLLACADSDIGTARNELQVLVDHVVDWCGQWCVSINVQKTEAKLFSLRRSPKPSCILIRGQAVLWKDEPVRWLGVWFDKRLTWKDHISIKVAEGYQRLSKLFPLINRRSQIAKKSAILIYKAILLPVVTYACPIWIAAAKSHTKKIQVFQNKVLRIICNAPWFVKNKNIRRDLGIVAVEETLVKRTIEFLRDNPHGIGIRNPAVRRIRPHLPQDLPDIIFQSS
ncbi:hypothetical protein M8J77_012467 [Diaphorina citri]|nr:hypothetical protein M8J77_012467 [Diaphorina citri]